MKVVSLPAFLLAATLPALALARAKVPAELHIFAHGGHGFGMKDIGKEVQQWPVLAGNWMRAMDLLGKN